MRLPVLEGQNKFASIYYDSSIVYEMGMTFKLAETFMTKDSGFQFG